MTTCIDWICGLSGERNKISQLESSAASVGKEEREGRLKRTKLA